MKMVKLVKSVTFLALQTVSAHTAKLLQTTEYELSTESV